MSCDSEGSSGNASSSSTTPSPSPSKASNVVVQTMASISISSSSIMLFLSVSIDFTSKLFLNSRSENVFVLSPSLRGESCDASMFISIEHEHEYCNASRYSISPSSLRSKVENITSPSTDVILNSRSLTTPFSSASASSKASLASCSQSTLISSPIGGSPGSSTGGNSESSHIAMMLTSLIASSA